MTNQREKPIRKTPLLAAVLIVMGLTGCASSGSSSSTQRYTLPSAPAAETSNASAKRTLVLNDVQVARYLNGQGIILQRDDIVLHQASSHLWAEDLSRQLSRGLRQRLANHLHDTRVLREGSTSDALHLRVDVEQFQGRDDGMAVAGGHWQVRAADGELLVFESFKAEVALEQDGYPALVRALGRSWDKVAEDIAARIGALD